MISLKMILVVDDSKVSRAFLSNMLSEEYIILEAENGQAALELLDKYNNEITAMILDLVMPVMDGYAVLEVIQKSDYHDHLPVIVITENGNHENERKALSFGAWDFISKPYDEQIVMLRLKNVIARSRISVLKELKYLAEYDELTGIYNKKKFFQATREMLDASCESRFVFLRFDVDRFQLINSFFGTAEGDKLLIYIAGYLAEDARKVEEATYGRIESDVFGLCLPYKQDEVKNMVLQAKQILAKFNLNYDIVPSIGIYVIEDPSISVEEMYNRATLATKTCKGNYVDFYAYYHEEMSAALTNEQEVTNDMNIALKNDQFEVYLQPKYNIHTNLPCGAEALVRWNHPEKGMIPPGNFIPVFERNGFITKLDYYVWEQACKYLQSWIAQGIQPYPLSVNVSRVNIYNPNLVETLMELVERYRLEPALLNLELTESAYTDNPAAMKKVMTRLQNNGFIIMMDDFGSGYSSLGLLKDIVIDILKIDMRFLSKTEIPGRGENIIASVIRMAKWLNIPIIAEGAETGEQVDFLRSVGCDYVQGYYFARPMPIVEYERLCSKLGCAAQANGNRAHDSDRYNDLLSVSPEMNLLFNNTLQAAAIYEFLDDRIELLRVNEAYYTLLGHEDMLAKAPKILDLLEATNQEALLNAFRICIGTRKTAKCEYMRGRAVGMPIWIRTKLCYVSMVGNRHIIIGELTDITVRRGVDAELQKYKENWMSDSHETHTVLIVDDAEINRTVLKKILSDQFFFLEAKNGEEAIQILRDHQNQVDLILLDISMPVMDGKEFLKYKKNSPELDTIPVIMVTGDDSSELQSSTFSLGANDYIVKPFIPVVVNRRVNNVLEANHRFREMVRQYNDISAQKQMEETIRTGVEKYETLVNSVPGGVGMYHLDETFTPIFISKRVYELCGMTGEEYCEATRNSTLDVFHPDDRKGLIDAVKLAYAENRKFEYTHRVLQRDGSYRWMRVSGQVMERADGTPVLYTVFTDIHEQIQTEQALRESESRYAAAVRSANINIWEYDYKSDTMTIFSKSPKVNLNNNVVANYTQVVISEGHIREDCAPLLLDIIERLKNGEKEVTADLWIRQNCTDEFRCERIIYSNAFDDKGNPVKAYCVGADITKEKEAEKRYHDELSYREAMQKATVASINVNLTQNVILDYKSNSPEVTAHMKAAKTVQAYFDQVYIQLVTDEMRCQCAAVINRDALLRQFTNGTTTLSMELTRKMDGRRYWTIMTVHMMKKENNDIVAYLYSTDVTNERTMQHIMDAVIKTDYDFLVVIDTLRDTAVRYSEKGLGNAYAHESSNFEKETQEYVRCYICSEDVSRVMEEITLKNILAQLDTQNTYSIFYGMPTSEGRILKKQLRFGYINRDLNSILMTRVDITAAVEEQEKKNRELMEAVRMAELTVDGR